jgi:IclR family transcriptional regulator, acetate operon repressor
VAVKTIQVVSRALAVLEAVSVRQPAGLGELARDLPMDKSAVQRILATLHEEGWIRPAPGDGGWVLTGRALSVGGRFAGDQNVRERVRGVLRAVHDATNETVWLTVVDGSTLIVADEIASTHPLRISYPVGYSGPFGMGTAGGKAILAAMDGAEVERVLGADGAAGAAEALGEVRRCGYAVQAEPGRPLWAASVPVPPATGTAAAVVVASPQDRSGERRLREFGELLARTIQQAFG